MKNYTITVNGNTYDVTVEENMNGNVNGSNEPPSYAKTKSTHDKNESVISFQQQTNTQSIKKEAVQVQSQESRAGEENIVADAAGKVIAIEKQAGETIQVGDTLFLLEIMKMETPVVAQKAGTLTSVQVNIGDLVKTDDVLATMKA